MDAEQPWYVGQRAEALAYLLLTSRPDLLVPREFGDSGEQDYVVELSQDAGGRAGRQFGVVVKGTTGLQSSDDARDWLDAHRRQLEERQEATFPVCLLLFSVDNHRGFFCWLLEPQIIDGRAKLAVASRPAIHGLTPHTLDDLVHAVGRWFDALMATLAA